MRASDISSSWSFQIGIFKTQHRAIVSLSKPGVTVQLTRYQSSFLYNGSANAQICLLHMFTRIYPICASHDIFNNSLMLLQSFFFSQWTTDMDRNMELQVATIAGFLLWPKETTVIKLEISQYSNNTC